jgi:branched-chain amino acid transport system ATP-binding protein
MLELRDVRASYGPVLALRGVSLAVAEGAMVTLLGANGAGKSSVLKAISRVLPVHAGEITYRGRSLPELPPHAVARLGIAHVPEGRRIFPEFTVEENLRIGAYGGRDGRLRRADIDRVTEDFPVLRERQRQVASTLSGGEQQMLALARALVARPAFLMVDEPSLGLAPLVVQALWDVLRRINERDGVTILLVEQNARLALTLASRAYVLEAGQVVFAGSGAELSESAVMATFYVGGAEDVPNDRKGEPR